MLAQGCLCDLVQPGKELGPVLVRAGGGPDPEPKRHHLGRLRPVRRRLCCHFEEHQGLPDRLHTVGLP